MSEPAVAVIATPEGKILARVCSVTNNDNRDLPDDQKAGPLRRYTAFCDWADTPGDYEEIDLDAVSASYARKCAEMELAAGYDPGGRVQVVEERFGLYL